MHQEDYSVEIESIGRRQAASTYRHIATTISCTCSATVMLHSLLTCLLWGYSSHQAVTEKHDQLFEIQIVFLVI